MMRICFAIGIAVTVGLTGCAMNDNLPSNPDERILVVKRQAQDAEMKAAKLVPSDARSGIEQIKQGTLLTCSSGKQWSGNTRIQLVDPNRGDTVLDDLGTEAADHGFTVTRNTTADGAPRLRMVDDQGTTLLVTVWVDGKSIDMDSFSECFSLPEDFVPERSY